MNGHKIIPTMTDPLGKYWKQPMRHKIFFDNIRAWMMKKYFEQLLENSSSNPTGIYIGKMWKACWGDLWYLRYIIDQKRTDNKLTIVSIQIMITDGEN